MEIYEKLGAFYLGKTYDLTREQRSNDLLLYDSKDLTTHGLCVGMTGSGKTGLCMALIEEAAIDGIPVIAVDPKGDIGNLMLRFPELAPSDFRPWIDESEAARKGSTPNAFAKKTASLWKTGLAEWGQDGERIRRLTNSAEMTIDTPGSTAGRPVTVLRAFRVPPQAVMDNADAFRDHVQAAVSGLLGLLGIDADPLTSREHVLLSTLLVHAWHQGRDLSLADVILGIQRPPFNKVGVFDLETFFPGSDRMGLALRLNNLMAAPGFQNWMNGDPLNIQDLLYSVGGKPRVSIMSIAHLSDPERMFFVTILLNELLSWMRQQPGTGSLRAIFYMDEIFGYFPPTQNPPSKTPMLTLLKQARAYGLGMLMATQNPVDLDYKGLSNTGTWFIGRLQTERDKLRVLDGLEGVSAASGEGFDRRQMEAILSGLGSRVFLMHNVHDDAPRVFETRWVLSYLRGPMTREQISRLTTQTQAPEAVTAPGRVTPRSTEPTDKPVVAAGVEEVFLPRNTPTGTGSRCIYRPGLFADVRARYAKAALGVDVWKSLHLHLELSEGDPVDWGEARVLETKFPEMASEGEDGATFAQLPEGATSQKSFTQWQKALAGHVYRDRPLTLFRCRALKATSTSEENEDAFRGRLSHAAREARDMAIEKLRIRYAKRLATCEDRIRRAEQRVAKESEQYQAAKMNTVVSIGATVIGAIFGRKLTSYRTVSSAGTTVRRAQRTGIERADIERAQAELETQQQKLDALTSEFEAAVEDITVDFDPNLLELEPVEIAPRKSDITVLRFGLVWSPE